MTKDTMRPPLETMFAVPGRECGTCAVCCKVFRVEELNKPTGIYCSHCTGKGCGIHETRPQVCRAFFCLWRQVATMPDALRPDRTGVVFTIEKVDPPQTPFDQLFIIGRAVNSIADLDSPNARLALQTFIERGDLPVWVSFENERRLMHPHGALRDAILRPGDPPPELAAEVRLWRQRLGLPT